MHDLIVRPDAEADITDAALWYEGQSQGLGSDFLRSVDACLADVARAPQRFPVIHRELHRALLRRFPYGLFFVAANGSITVVACLHARRNPQQWSQRLRRGR
ncbi:MAG: type II toxin-antitoxin system RelE/ParE family toxin [Actinomycetota bacterium]|nr:type II toxin-antitoxin system RelE/ParE family toxin [Actinomycetota bacterium]MDP3630226.1 type II toxin-antitoxin system RelE/ParE family toxin [Actinomycetota bacterium]